MFYVEKERVEWWAGGDLFSAEKVSLFRIRGNRVSTRFELPASTVDLAFISVAL